MVSPINTALSGLAAASTRIAVSTENVANQFSKNYVPKQVDQVTLSAGAVRAVVKDVDPATTPIFNPSDPDADVNGTVQLPNVDLANELVNQSIASYDYKANLQSIKAADNLQKSLLDILS
ncbi:MAG: flagellar basal body rod protein FlgC [Rickettsiales bacterium]